MNKFIKKFYTLAMSLAMILPTSNVVHADNSLTYGGIGETASEGKFLLDVKDSNVSVNGSTMSSDGSRQEVESGAVVNIKDASFIAVYNKDGSQESYTGDLDYQTTSNTAYISVLGGVDTTPRSRRTRRSTGSVDDLVVGDTFSGTFGTNNTDGGIGNTTFYVDAITGLLSSVSDQIIGSQYVECQEHGYIGLTNINAWSLGRKAEYTYNATVTAVAPDGTVTLSIYVPHYLKPGTNQEATGWSAGLGTVPYQACAGTWTIRTAPRTMQMYVRVNKTNGNPDITRNNQCYAQDLSGAVYGVFADQSCTNKLGEITTDANGKGVLQNITVNTGAYVYVKELKAPKGFALDSTIHSIYSLSHEATGWDVNSTDMPMNDPVAIKLTKKSEDVVENPASLEGAEFTVKYYAGQYTKETLPETATRTWVIKTLKVGSIYKAWLDDAHKVSGDAFYLDNGVPTLPLGTVTVEETKAPEGYTLTNKTLSQSGTQISDGVALFNIEHDAQDIPQVVGGNEYTIEEGVARGSFNSTKVDKATGEKLAGAKFKIVNKNAYDIMLKDSEGHDIEEIKAGAESNYTFGTQADGTFTGWDNMLQAGNYALREVQAPVNYELSEDVDFLVEQGKISDVRVADKEKEPVLRTQAHEYKTGSKLVKEGKVTLEDVADYENVKPGTYKYTTTLIAKGKTEAEDEVIYKNVTTQELADYNGSITVQAEVDTSKYGDKELVFYEELERVNKIEGHNYDVAHKNRDDKDQTIKTTKIRTTIKDSVDGDNIIDGTKTEQKVIDTVSYVGLVVGKKYTVTGTLMDKATGLPVLINGQPVTNTVEFTATDTKGTVEVPFTFNATKVAGKRIVAFESVKDENGLELGMHADINDESQTFDVTMKLKLRIAKADADNVSHFLKGAEFTLYNADGTIYKDINGKDAIGVTDGNGEVVMNVVYTVANEGAYVMETKAPEGYEISTEKYPVKLTGKDELGVDLITIHVLDNAIIIPPTGVDSNPFVWAGVALLALAGIVSVVVLKKRNK